MFCWLMSVLKTISEFDIFEEIYLIETSCDVRLARVAEPAELEVCVVFLLHCMENTSLQIWVLSLEPSPAH